MTSLNWRMGLEIELLAPPGKSRHDLAAAIAQAHGGTVHRFFHPQSEPSKVPGTPVFHNLTLGFQVVNANLDWVASCVDDLTLQDDLVRQAPPQAGWYRILSDDERLLRLVERQCDPASPLEVVLDPLANLFGTVANPGPGGMIRVDDAAGYSVAIAAPLPGERERPCELITAPLDECHQERLDGFLGLARALGFTAPQEGATHLHFDATALQSAGAMANLVQLLWTYGGPLKRLLGTNPHCRRLGAWPAQLIETVSSREFRQLSWVQARSHMRQIPLTKFCDFNLLNCINGLPYRNTIEVRILPVWLESQPLLEAAILFAAILRYAVETRVVRLPSSQSVTALLRQLPLEAAQRKRWLSLAQGQ